MKDKQQDSKNNANAEPKGKKQRLAYKPVNINLREDWLRRIEAAKGDISRHKWIIKAILEKLSQGESQQEKVLKTIFRRKDGSFGIRRGSGLAHEEQELSNKDNSTL